MYDNDRLLKDLAKIEAKSQDPEHRHFQGSGYHISRWTRHPYARRRLGARVLPSVQEPETRVPQESLGNRQLEASSAQNEEDE